MEKNYEKKMKKMWKKNYGQKLWKNYEKMWKNINHE